MVAVVGCWMWCWMSLDDCLSVVRPLLDDCWSVVRRSLNEVFYSCWRWCWMLCCTVAGGSVGCSCTVFGDGVGCSCMVVGSGVGYGVVR